MRRTLSASRSEEVLAVLRARFDANQTRHPGLVWSRVQARLESRAGGMGKLWSLAEMELTGGEPDVVGHNRTSDEYLFVDCAPESPAGRRSVCYDRAGLESRKEHRPKASALELAAAMGIALLTEEEYLALQRLGEFDRKTSSWIATPADVRQHGGALYAERRYGRVFIGHNGAQSYYAVRGFRGVLRV